MFVLQKQAIWRKERKVYVTWWVNENVKYLNRSISVGTQHNIYKIVF